MRRLRGERDSVQQIVEEPEIYMLYLSSSSLSDQLSTIADRLDCLYDFEETITSTNGIPITYIFFLVTTRLNHLKREPKLTVTTV